MSYFDELFGTPEVQRRENWNGQGEPIQPEIPGPVTLAQAMGWRTRIIHEQLPQAPEVTIDTDYEEVD